MKHVSASQYTSFANPKTGCPRAWYFEKVLKFPKPPSPALDMGLEIHAEVEHYLTTGELRPSDWSERIQKAVRFFPRAEGLLLEHELGAPRDAAKGKRREFTHGLDTFPGGPKWVGYVDCVEPGAIPHIFDWKSTSDFRNCKDAEWFKTDPQMISYSRWAVDEWKANNVVVSHVYIRTRGSAAARESDHVLLSREHIISEWNSYLPTVQKMVALAKSGCRAEDVAPNTAACNAYGGCPYRLKCGLDGGTMSRASVMERIKAKRDQQLSAAKLPALPEPEAVAEEPSIVPPDAPSRETKAEDLTPAVENSPAPAAKKRGRPRKEAPVAQKEVSDAVSLVNDDSPEDDSAASERVSIPGPLGGSTVLVDVQGLTEALSIAAKPIIFVDCFPVKGSYPAITLLEDWLAPLIKEAADLHEVPDYRMIKYEAKAVLGTLVRAKVEAGEAPNVIVATSYNSGTDVALEILIPTAALVVKGLRG